MDKMDAMNIWITKKMYDAAEVAYYENLSKKILTPLAGQVAMARQKLIDCRSTVSDSILTAAPTIDTGASKFIEMKILEFENTISNMLEQLNAVTLRVTELEKKIKPTPKVSVLKVYASDSFEINDEDDDLISISDSDEEETSNVKTKLESLAAYVENKSEKPHVAKSSITLDIKPWNDETDMKILEENVRKIHSDGLIWGESKLVPLAYGINKLQITSVVEDDKISVDWLTDSLGSLTDYIQSVEIVSLTKL